MLTESEFTSKLVAAGFVYENNQQWADLIFSCINILADASISIKSPCDCELCVNSNMVKTAQNLLTSIKNDPTISLEVYLDGDDTLVVQLCDGIDGIYTKGLTGCQREHILNSGIIPISTTTKKEEEEIEEKGYFSRIYKWFTKRI